jgi:hypothetical protein
MNQGVHPHYIIQGLKYEHKNQDEFTLSPWKSIVRSFIAVFPLRTSLSLNPRVLIGAPHERYSLHFLKEGAPPVHNFFRIEAPAINY